jgi:hypothetical protein
LNNILSNFIASIIKNPITIIFLIIITLYAIIKIIENNMLHNHIKNTLNELYTNESSLYLASIEKYNKYKEKGAYAKVDLSSLTEEIASSLTYKNKTILCRIKKLKDASSVCILLGVLGTFIGLSSMLLTIDTSDIINSLPSTISSMQIAFTTSIFGVILSIIVSSIIKNKDCEQVLLRIMLHIENSLTAKVTHEEFENENKKFEDLKNTIKEIKKSIESIEKFEDISLELKTFNEAFITSIETLKELLTSSNTSIENFDQSIRNLDKQFNILNLKFDNLFEKYDSQDLLNKEILLDMKECTKNIYDSNDTQLEVRDYIKNINEEFTLISMSTKEVLDGLLISSNELNTQKIDLNSNLKNLSSIITLSSNELQEKMDSIFSYIDLLKSGYISEEEIYEIDNEQELNERYKDYNSTLTVIKNPKDISGDIND